MTTIVSSAAGGNGKKSGLGRGSTKAIVVGGVGSEAGAVAEVNSKRVVVAGGSGVGAGSAAVAAGDSAKGSLWPKNRRTKRSAAAGSIRDAQRSLAEMPVARAAASGVKGTSVRKRSRIHSYEGKKMESTVRTFNHRVCGTKAESGEGTKRVTHSGHPTTSPPRQPPDCA